MGAASEPLRILFVTANGTGLGHLTRSMAIGRRLPAGAEAWIATLSQAAPVAARLGFPVEYVASYTTPLAGSPWRWSRRLRMRLDDLLDELGPAVCAFDGPDPYQGLLEAMRNRGELRAVWCRRAMWQPGAGEAPLAHGGAFDAVLEPGELAASEDRGPTVAHRSGAHLVDPIVYCRDSELVPREQAARELGLDPDRTTCLLQLGQGPEVAPALDRCLRALGGRPGLQVAALSSAIAERPLQVPANVVPIEAAYPISRLFAAFDLAVSAAGYNAFHELARFGVPSLFVPMPRRTDDQAARSRWAGRTGIGVGVSGSADPKLEASLERLLDLGERTAMAERLASIAPGDGAGEAARWLAGLAGTGVGGSEGQAPQRSHASPRLRRLLPSRRSPGAALRHYGRLAVLSLRVVRDLALARHPRLLLVALGLGEECVGRVASAIAEAGERPERTLVVTDSLDFAGLRGLGVGFERVPGPEEAAARPGGRPWGELVARRLRLIRAERRPPKRTVLLGSVPPELGRLAGSSPALRYPGPADGT